MSARRRPKPKNDARDGDVGPDDVGKDQSSQAEDGAEPPKPRFRRLQRGERPAADKRDGAAEEDVPERKRLIEQQPQNEQAGAHQGKGQEPRHVGPIRHFGRSAAGPSTPRM